jgi:carbamoyl-phosphate synthase large subunit
MNDNRQQHILVTAAGGPAGVNALRLLRKHPELRLFGVDINPESIGKDIADEFAVMAPFGDFPRYREELRKIVMEWKIDVVVPTLADELHEVAEALAGLPVRVLVSPKQTALICSDKRLLYAWMQEHLPEYITRWQTLDQPLSWDAPTYFVKPAVGRGARGCTRVTKEDLPALIAELEHPEEWVVMDLLPGKEWTVDAYVSADGEPIFIVPRVRLEVVSGISRRGQTERHPQVIAQTYAIIQQLKFVGPLCVQWKEDPQGDIKLVEINARLSGGLMITVASGADPMQVFVDELMDRQLVSPEWKEGEFTGFTDFTRAV